MELQGVLPGATGPAALEVTDARTVGFQAGLALPVTPSHQQFFLSALASQREPMRLWRSLMAVGQFCEEVEIKVLTLEL